MILCSVKRLKLIKGVTDDTALKIRHLMQYAEVRISAPANTDESRARFHRQFDFDYDMMFCNPYGWAPTTRANRIRYALQEIDKLIGTFGVEHLQPKIERRVFYPIDYLNNGDTYTLTLMFDWCSERWFVSSWGDFVERHGDWFK